MNCLRTLPLLALLLAGCVAGTPLGDVELSDEAVVVTVPVVLQDSEYDCGVSALSMLLAYYAEPADSEMVDELRAKAELEQGLTGNDLVGYLESEGFETALFEGALDDTLGGLYYHLDRGRPLVCAMNFGEGENHFVLVTGYDPVNEWILLQDPTRGSIVYPAANFEHAWEKALRFTLLATPAE